jgi:hypothetical protein
MFEAKELKAKRWKLRRPEGGRENDGRGKRDEGRRRSESRGQQLQIKSAKDLKVYQKAYALAKSA